MSASNLVGLLDGPARWAQDRAAILFGDGRCGPGARSRKRSRAAGGLRTRFGVLPGDTVALFAANCPEYLELLFATWHAGGVVVPISSRLHAREAAALCDSSRARVCFATPTSRPRTSSARAARRPWR